MPLPTAVARKAEQARQSVAAKSGRSDAGLLQSDDEYIKSVTNPSEQSRVAPATSEAPNADQHQRAREGQYVPHSLSDDATPASRAASNQLSDKDSDGDAQGTRKVDRPDFVDLEDFKTRFNILRGTRDERSENLERQLAEQVAQNRSLTQQLAEATRGDQAAEQQKFDERATKAFGEDGAELFNQINSRIDDRLDAQVRRSMNVFESDMDSLVPRWRQINVEAGFLNYLRGIDDVMGVSRQVMLDRIVDNRDAKSAAAVFRNYVTASNGQAQQRDGSQVPELSTQRSGSSLGAEENLVEEWSESEIADFYQRKSRLYQAGKLNGQVLENVNADEARIRSAMSEGRVYKG